MNTDLSLLNESVKRELFTLEDLMLRDSAITIDSLISHYVKDNNSRQSLIDSLAANFSRLDQLGFDQFVASYASDGTWSSMFSDTLVSIKDEFETFVNLNQPSLDQTISFWNSKLIAIPTYGLCTAEQQLLEIYCRSAIGFAEYLYFTINQSIVTTNGIEFRGCNFFQTLLCGTLSIVVGAATAASTAIATMLGFEQLVNAGVIVSTSIQGQEVPLETFAIVVGIVTGIIATVKFFKFCCDWFSDDPPCRAVQNYSATLTECNDYLLELFGAGTNVLNYVWNNENTNPASIITSVPSLEVSIPDPSSPVIIRAQVICDNGFISSWFIESANLGNGGSGSIGWAIPPPETAIVGQTVSVAVSAQLGYPYSLSWNSSTGGSITPTGPYSADVTFWNTGNILIEATVANECSGNSSSVSKTVQVSYQ
ncbi:MAG: hypothetical protein Kow0027_24050 [Saprospiraceae bacterium]